MTLLSEKLIEAMQNLPTIISLVLFAWMTLLAAIPEEDREGLLSRDRDGMRLFMLGLGAMLLSLFAWNGMSMYAILTFGTQFLVLGALVWMKDSVTNVFFKSHSMSYCYFLIAYAVFISNVFKYGSTGTLNLIGLIGLAVPVGLAILFGSMAAFALLSEEVKARLLPKDNNGYTMMFIGFIVLTTALYGSNPIMLVVSATFAAILAALGAIIASNDALTIFALKTRMFILYAPLAALFFFLA